MDRIILAFLICLLSQSSTRADELEALRVPLPVGERAPQTLNHAITIEAARLAKSSALERRVPSSQTLQKTDTRPWCVRHGTGCFALIGYVVGFIGGLMNPADDFVPEGWAVAFSGPIGAGIGAAVGWCIAEGTKPQPVPPRLDPPQQKQP